MLYIGMVFIMISTLVIFSLCKIAGEESRIADEESRIYMVNAVVPPVKIEK